MGRLVEFVTPLHKRAKRSYVERMLDDKVHCMKKAREYELDYWDGDRRYGYGGYRYDGRWKPVAEKLIETYGLGPDAIQEIQIERSPDQIDPSTGQVLTQVFYTDMFFDALGRGFSTVDNVGNARRSYFDSRGNVTFTTDANTNATTTVTVLVRPSTPPSSPPGGGTLSLTANQDGNAVIHIVDDVGREITTDRELHQGRDGQQPLAVVARITTSQAWDANSNLASQTDGNLHTTAYAYNSRNLKVSTIYADGTQSRVLTVAQDGVDGFDNDDLVTQTIDANMSKFTAVFDPEHRRVSFKSAAPATNTYGVVPVSQVFAFDGLSRAVLASDMTGAASQVTTSFDSVSRAVSENQSVSGMTHTVGRTFDPNNNKTSLAYPNGRALAVNYLDSGACCTLNRIYSLSDSSGQLAQFGYIGPSRMISRTDQDGVNLAASYDAVRRPVQITHGMPSSPVAGFNYGYDPEGNRTFEQFLHEPVVVQIGSPPASVTEYKTDHYDFDSVVRIVQESRSVLEPSLSGLGDNVLPTSTPASTAQETQWILDNADNRQRQNVIAAGSPLPGSSADTESYTPNAVNEYSSIDDLFTATNDPRMYDANGNLVFDQAKGNVYQYDALNRLVAVYGGGSYTAPPVPPAARATGIQSATWDAMNRRVMKTVTANAPLYQQSRIYSYDGQQVIEEDDATGVNPPQTYVWGNGALVQFQNGGGSFFCHENASGSIYAVTVEQVAPGNELLAGLATGTVVDRMVYTVMGSYQDYGYSPVTQTLSTTGSLLAVSGLPYFSRCWRSDPELGLLVAGDLLYDPVTDRTIMRALTEDFWRLYFLWLWLNMVQTVQDIGAVTTFEQGPYHTGVSADERAGTCALGPEPNISVRAKGNSSIKASFPFEGDKDVITGPLGGTWKKVQDKVVGTIPLEITFTLDKDKTTNWKACDYSLYVRGYVGSGTGTSAQRYGKQIPAWRGPWTRRAVDEGEQVAPPSVPMATDDDGYQFDPGSFFDTKFGGNLFFFAPNKVVAKDAPSGDDAFQFEYKAKVVDSDKTKSVFYYTTTWDHSDPKLPNPVMSPGQYAVQTLGETKIPK